MLLTLIEGYQRWISPLHPPCCRYIPSCSAYAKQAISRFGALKGGLLALWRIMRCNPFSRGGYDPVPEEFRFVPRRLASGIYKDVADRILSEEDKEEYKEHEYEIFIIRMPRKGCFIARREREDINFDR